MIRAQIFLCVKLATYSYKSVWISFSERRRILQRGHFCAFGVLFFIFYICSRLSPFLAFILIFVPGTVQPSTTLIARLHHRSLFCFNTPLVNYSIAPRMISKRSPCREAGTPPHRNVSGIILFNFRLYIRPQWR